MGILRPALQESLGISHVQVKAVAEANGVLLARIDAAPDHRPAPQAPCRDAQTLQHRLAHVVVGVVEGESEFAQPQHDACLVPGGRVACPCIPAGCPLLPSRAVRLDPTNLCRSAPFHGSCPLPALRWPGRSQPAAMQRPRFDALAPLRPRGPATAAPGCLLASASPAAPEL